MCTVYMKSGSPSESSSISPARVHLLSSYSLSYDLASFSSFHFFSCASRSIRAFSACSQRHDRQNTRHVTRASKDTAKERKNTAKKRTLTYAADLSPVRWIQRGRMAAEGGGELTSRAFSVLSSLCLWMRAACRSGSSHFFVFSRRLTISFLRVATCVLPAGFECVRGESECVHGESECVHPR